jgi:hypothetical protein
MRTTTRRTSGILDIITLEFIEIAPFCHLRNNTGGRQISFK